MSPPITALIHLIFFILAKQTIMYDPSFIQYSNLILDSLLQFYPITRNQLLITN